MCAERALALALSTAHSGWGRRATRDALPVARLASLKHAPGSGGRTTTSAVDAAANGQVLTQVRHLAGSRAASVPCAHAHLIMPLAISPSLPP